MAPADPPALRYDTISFLSDLGQADEYVGVIHSVIRSVSPAVTIVDVSHGLAPRDVRGAGLALARSAQYLRPGVVLAAVDPAFGIDRRCVGVEVGGGSAVLVGPDNGVLAPAVAMVGGADRAVALDRTELHLETPGARFDARDVLAPVAAHLCNGVPLTALGSAIDPAGLTPGVLPVAHTDGPELVAEVLWVDRFGNLQLNVDPADLADADDVLGIRCRTGARTAVRPEDRAALTPGQIGLVVDGYGLLALVVAGGSATDELGIGAGDEVRIGDADAPSAGAVPVHLGDRRRPS